MTKLPLLLILLPVCVISESLNSELSTLLTIKHQWGNPPSLSSWNSTTSPCSWEGIQCSAAAAGNSTGVVTGISLFNANSINSPIPPSICDLQTLRTLNLSWNYIPGRFPTALHGCSALTHLDLSGNLFWGPIPDDMDKLLPPSLQYLDLSYNNFTGNIPRSIGGLKQLKTLYLIENFFNGTFPSEISNLSKLEDLQMAYNPFMPMALPSEWGKLKNLKFLFMRETNLVGGIPESFGGLEGLEHLDLVGNELVGRIPEGLFSVNGLRYLYLYRNKLSGGIPSSVRALNLTEIDLSDNELSGSIPEEFGKLKRLKILNLFSNNLSGQMPASIGLLPELEILKVFYNNLFGPLPPELGLHSKFQILEIGGNWFSGPLPENICSRGALIGITCSLSNLSGKLPKSLGKCTTLRTLLIYNNNFTGEIPAGVWTLPHLYALRLSFNGFTGHLPDRISDNMTSLEVSYNKFSGPIPSGIASWKNIKVFLAANNKLSDKLPLGLTSLSRLTTLTLEANQLSGDLPLTNNNSWASLITLNLARNEFSGPIPEAIGWLPRLVELDLSSNDFSGEIPPQFEQLKLTFLDLSNNKLSGKIPLSLDKKAFSGSFQNNTNLCTTDKIRILTLPRCSSLSSFSSNHLSATHLALILVLVVIVFSMTLYLIVFAIKTNKRRKRNDELPPWKFTPFQKLEFTEHNIITSLSEQHLIGSGGSGKVYRVQVDNNSNYSVAVKRIWNNQQVNNAQFLAEVEILGKIRHTNIVKLLCCISNENTKLLVYEHMENQSLDRWLHKRRRLESERRGNPLPALDWPTSLRIAIGAAQGLCYMHHDCGLPIIHRDVKSSNILLDSEFNAKIADFGLARMTVKQGELHSVSSVAGSFGYLAPEYRSTRKVNEKIDVYSFGVVLLELVTGKEPNSRDETLNLADSSWRHCCEDKPIVDGLDEEVMREEYIEDMSSVFRLGIICTSPLPNSRPCMIDVLQVLRRSSPVEEAEDGNRSSEDSEQSPGGG